MKNYSSFIFALLTFILVFMASYNVYLFGDDYYYITYSQGTIQEFWAHHIEHYKLINGRAIVHFLVSVFLSVNLIWWKLFNSFMIASIVYFGSKIACKNTLYSGFILFLGVCSIGIDVSRQSIYWVTGSFNYVYPIFILFVYWYFLLKYRESNKHAIQMYILAFVASATVEQGAMMALGLTILLGIKDFIVNRKIDKKYILITIFSFLGAVCIILSPATFVRFNLENQENVSLIAKLSTLLKFLLRSYLLTKWMIPINISFILLGLNKAKNIFLKSLIILCIPVLLFGVYNASINHVMDYLTIIICIFLLAVYSLIIIKTIIIELKEIKTSSAVFTIATVLLIGSQIMLVVSSVYGHRNLLFGIFMFVLMIATLTRNVKVEELNLKSVLPLVAFLPVVVIALYNQTSIINGYKISHMIEEKNISKIKNNTYDRLILDTPDINYTWSMPYVSEYHKYYYKMYYKIDDIDVEWK